MAAAEGFDKYSTGIVGANFPWFPGVTANTAQITAGTGAFPTGTPNNALSMNRGATALTQGLTYQFPSNATFQRNNTATNGKALFAFNSWVRVDSAATTIAASNLLTLTTSTNTALAVPLLGISNDTTNGLNLLMPSTVAGISTSPYRIAIATAVYHWMTVKFAVYPNAQMKASYYIDTIPIQENVSITFGSDPLSTNIMNRLGIWSGTTACSWSLDDMVIQCVDGSDPTWPSGFTGGVPNDPNLTDLPTLTPRRIPKLTATADGSLTQWTSDDGTTPNWEAATTSGHFVQAADSGLTDLYKFEVPAGIVVSDCTGIIVSANTNKYLSVEPATKDNSGASLVNNPGLVSKGVSSFQTVLEQTQANQTWTTALIEGAEFGQTSL
jgi:hypothetical protein